MDEKTLIQDILQKMLDKAQGTKTKRIRVVNLSVYDKDVDPIKLTHAFETLTFSTPAQGAQLHVRRGENISKNSSLDPLAPRNLIRLDSLEVEDALIPAR